MDVPRLGWVACSVALVPPELLSERNSAMGAAGATLARPFAIICQGWYTGTLIRETLVRAMFLARINKNEENSDTRGKFFYLK
jgi:hypothetical protein